MVFMMPWLTIRILDRSIKQANEIKMRSLYLIFMVLLLSACTGLPDGVQPVDNFDMDRYLGKWYEIARLDHSFERGLNNVSAEYTLRDDGGVSVLNTGYDIENKQWKSATGKAYFVDRKNRGHLKVSFFGPFYGSYVIFDLDKKDYSYAYIAGYDKSNLWLLARTPRVSENRLREFTKQAKVLGFDTDELIYVKHDQ